MINIDLAKKYWDNFYKLNTLTNNESNFANFCHEFTKNKNIFNAIDVGSGNFRDSLYFLKKKMKVTSIDINEEAYIINKKKLNAYKKFKFICSDISNLKKYKFKKNFDFIYARFFIHTLSIRKEKEFTKWTFLNLSKKGYFCIETRVNLDKEIVKKSNKQISKDYYEFEKGHYRRFIHSDEFISRLLKIGFKIRFANISRDFSKIKIKNKYENPILMRLILTK